MIFIAVIPLRLALAGSPKYSQMPDRCFQTLISLWGRAKRSGARPWFGACWALFLNFLSLLLMFSLAVILVCGLLWQTIPNDPRCVRDAPQILIHVGASELKRSEAVVWGLLHSFS